MASDLSNLKARTARLSLRSLASDTAGAALVELTLFMPILVLMAVAIINFGLYFSFSIQVENAAQAGAITNAGYSQSSIQNAGTGANNSSLPSVSPTISVPLTCSGGSTCCIQRYCGCPSSSGVTSPPAGTTPPSCAIGPPECSGTACLCSDGSYPGTYVQACAKGTFTPFSKFGSFFPSSYSLSSTATVRVQ